MAVACQGEDEVTGRYGQKLPVLAVHLRPIAGPQKGTDSFSPYVQVNITTFKRTIRASPLTPVDSVQAQNLCLINERHKNKSVPFESPMNYDSVFYRTLTIIAIDMRQDALSQQVWRISKTSPLFLFRSQSYMKVYSPIANTLLQQSLGRLSILKQYECISFSFRGA